MPETRIGLPRIERVNNGRIRLIADISLPGGTNRDLWFETSASNASHIVHERSDAFLVGLIPFISRNGGKVVCEAPVSGYLLHNLRNLLSPVLPEFHPDLFPLQIDAPYDSIVLSGACGTHVGTGCSCGIDSMATIYTYTTPDTPPSMRVDTLTFFDVGSHGDRQSDRSGASDKTKEFSSGRARNIEAFAHEIGLPLIKATSNISDFNAGFSHINLHTFRNTATVLVVQKYFKAYHYASGFHISHFCITMDELSHADEFLLRCLSTESTVFHSALASMTRQDRTKLASEFGLTGKYLNVCVSKVNNCGFCFKCARTMFQLDLIGKLDDFSNVFDVQAYRENPRRILRLLSKDTHFHDEFLAAAKASTGCVYSLLKLKSAFALGKIAHILVNIRKRLIGKKRI